MKITTKITLDLQRPNFATEVEVMQDDGETRILEISLASGGTAWNVPAGVSPVVVFRRPNYTKGMYDKLADGSPAVSVSGNTVTAVLSRQMLAIPGLVQASLQFEDASLNQLTTFPFRVNVQANPYGGAQSVQDVVRLQWLEEKLDEYLKKAAESGEFDGPPGPQGLPGKDGAVGPAGLPGKTPVKGVDYWTDAEVQAAEDAVYQRVDGKFSPLVKQAQTDAKKAVTTANAAKNAAAAVSGEIAGKLDKPAAPPVAGQILTAGAVSPDGGFETSWIFPSIQTEKIDAIYSGMVNVATSTQAVDALFVQWWKLNAKSGADNVALLSRWFGSVLQDTRVHGVKMPLFSTSQSYIGELTNDSIGLVCEPSTATKAGRDDFAYLPQFWTLEVAMERNMDGTHTISKIEHIDPIEEVRSGNHGLCQVLQKNTWVREWKDGQYHYMQMCCDPVVKDGWHTWPQGTSKTGKVYPYIANPKYAAGIGADGIITCGTGLAPVSFTSHSAGVSLWRKRGSQYSGASGSLIKWQLAMIWLKYAKKGNSGTIEGCTGYWEQPKAALGENGVQRVLLTVDQGKNFFVGSTVSIGTFVDGKTDRNNPETRNLADRVVITAIETVSIGDVQYAAISVDNAGKTFDTVAGATIISSMPYHSGYNDAVLGYDGSRTNPVGSKEPGLIQRTEFQNGAYLIISDELWQWSKDAEGNFCFDCYTCHDQSKVARDAITSDYTNADRTLKFSTGTPDGMQYIEDIAIGNDPAVLWPSKVSTAAGSGAGVRARFYVQPRESGVRAAWCFGDIGSYSRSGLAACSSGNGPGYSYWSGAAGCPSGISG